MPTNLEEEEEAHKKDRQSSSTTTTTIVVVGTLYSCNTTVVDRQIGAAKFYSDHVRSKMF